DRSLTPTEGGAPMSPWQLYRDDVIFTCQKHKAIAERAFGQLNADEFFKKPAAHSNSVAAIVKHLAGNLLSRWTDFLTSDGDKPWRDRDAEFVIGPDDHELGVAIAPWLVAVAGEEIGPARQQVAGQVLDDGGDAVGMRGGFLEEFVGVELAKSSLGNRLVLLAGEDDVVAIKLPRGHGCASLCGRQRSI